MLLFIAGGIFALLIFVQYFTRLDSKTPEFRELAGYSLLSFQVFIPVGMLTYAAVCHNEDLPNFSEFIMIVHVFIMMVFMILIILLHSKLSLLDNMENRVRLTRQIIENTHNIVRFLSHEIRTPLSNIFSLMRFIENDIERGIVNVPDIHGYIKCGKYECDSAIITLDDMLVAENIITGNIFKFFFSFLTIL
jgi:hypothetical protein